MKKFLNLNSVSKLNQGDFIELIKNIFDSIENIKISYAEVEKIWNNIYMDLFNRSYYFNDFDVVELNTKYLKLMKKYGNDLKKFNSNKKIEKQVIYIKNDDIPKNSFYENYQNSIFVFDNLNDLEFFITNNFKNKEYNFSNFAFKIGKSTEYKQYTSILVTDEERGNMTFKIVFTSECFGVGEYEEPAIELVIKTRYIKTKDILLLKNIEYPVKFTKIIF